MRASPVALCALLAAASCARLDAPSPVPRAIQPGRAHVASRTAVVIRGEGFAVRTVQPAAGGAPTVDATYRAWLGATPLEEVTWVDARTLRALVPAGLPLGTHALAVEGPFGTRGRLEGAFEVVAATAADLVVVLAPGAAIASVGQTLNLAGSVTNTGTDAALDVTPSLVASTAVPGAVLLGTPDPAGVGSLAAGATATFAWQAVAAGPGVVALSATAAAVDRYTGAAISSASAPRTITIVPPPLVSASLARAGGATPASVGQPVALTLRIVNGGGAAADLTVAPTFFPPAAGTCTAPTPGAGSVPAGGESTFTWTCAGSSAGAASLGASVTSTDPNSGDTLPVPVTPLALTVQTPAVLAATDFAASRSAANVGQAVAVSLTLANPGGATASVLAVSPAFEPGATGTCDGPAPAPPRSIVGGGSQAFTWSCTGTAPGAASLRVAVTGADANSGAAASAAAGPLAVTIQRPATLDPALATSPASATLGQPFAVALTLSNAGDAAATVSTVTPTWSPAGSATCTGSAPAPPLSIAGGGSATFGWSCTATAAGALTLGALVAGADANTGAALGSAPSTTIPASGAAALGSASLGASPSPANVGQPVRFTFTLSNTGARAASVTGVSLTRAGTATATCTAPAPGTPLALAAGQTASFTSDCTATASGTLTVTASAAGADATTLAPLSAAAGPVTVAIQRPATLDPVLVVTPTNATVGQTLTVSLALSNAGDAAAYVTTVTPTWSPASNAACTAPAPAPPRSIAGGATQAFAWTCTPTVAANLTLGAAVAGQDATSGAPLAGAPSTTISASGSAALGNATLGASPNPANVGQAVRFGFTFVNTGGRAANVGSVTFARSGSAAATCTAASPAPPFTLAAGQSATIVSDCTTSGAGTITMNASASGTDATTAAPLSTAAGPLNVNVQRPATLDPSLATSPATATVGEPFAVTLTLSNAGDAAAYVTTVTPTWSPPASATCGGRTPAPPRTVAGGGSLAFSWTCTPSAAGTLSVGASAGGSDLTSGAPLQATPSRAVPAVSPAALGNATLVASSALVNVAQPVQFTFGFSNTGGRRATVTAVSLARSGTATAACPVTGPALPLALDPGASAAFVATCTASTTGTVAITASASGADATSGAAVAAAAGPASATVQRPAALGASIAANPTNATIGSPVAVTLTLSNSGDAAAYVTTVTPTWSPPANATCSERSPALPQTLSGGGSLPFTWTCTPSAGGTLTLGATVAARDLTSSAAVPVTPSASPSTTVSATGAAAFGSASLVAARPTTNTSQSVRFTFAFTNTGGRTATVTGVAFDWAAGTASATCAPASYGAVGIAPGEVRSFVTDCTASTTGTIVVSASATGQDATSLAPLSAAAGPTTVTVQAPAQLAASPFTASRDVANQGQLVDLSLTVTNTGGALATVTGVTPSLSGGGSCGTPLPATPQVLPSGASVVFGWSCSGTALGAAALAASVAGADGNSGAALAAAPTALPLTIQRPAALGATIVATPTSATIGSPVAVTLTLANTGDAAAYVTTVTPTWSPPESGTCTGRTPAPPETIAGAASRDFTWSCTPGAAGTLTLGATVAASDVTSAAAVPITPSSSPSTTVSATGAAAFGSASLAAERPTTNTDQPVRFTFSFTNTGGRAATVTGVTFTPSGTAGATCATPSPNPTPGAPAALAAGQSATFTTDCSAALTGSIVVSAGATGQDATNLAPLSAIAGPTSPVEVQAPASVVVTAFGRIPPTVNQGQLVDVTLTVENQGGALATVTGVTPSLSGGGSCATPSPATPRLLSAGAIVVFGWSCSGTTVGDATLSASVAWTDGNSGASFTAAPTDLPLTVQRPAALGASLVASPASVAVGEEVAVTLTLSNSGDAAARITTVTPTWDPAGNATCSERSPALPQTISTGGSLPFTWSCTPGAAGTLTLGATVAASDVTSAAAVPITPSSSPSTTVSATGAAAFGSASLAAGRPTTNTDQPVRFTFSFTNTGGRAATVTGVAFDWTASTATATCTTPSPDPTPGAPAALADGQSATFTTDCTASTTGTIVVSASATGQDATSLAPLSASAGPASVTGQVPAALSITSFTAGRTTANTDQAIAVSLTVANAAGAATATGVAASPSFDPASSGTCTAAAPATRSLAGTASGTFDWTCTGTAAGSATLHASATGTDGNTGAAIAPAAATGIPVTIQLPATLDPVLTATPTIQVVNQPIAVTLTLSDAGDAAAYVTTVARSWTPNTGQAIVSCTPPAPAATPSAPVTLPGRGSVQFTWTCTANLVRDRTLHGSAQALDANTGALLTTVQTAVPVQWVASLAPAFLGAPTASATTDVVLLSSDPLGDGSPFARLAALGGSLLVGPDASGTRLALASPLDGSVTSVDLALAVDAGPTPAANAAWLASAPATTIGAPGCAAGTTACGPDDEAGLAVLAAGTLWGADRIALAGAGRYLYLSGAPATPLEAAWVDLRAALPPGSAGARAVALGWDEGALLVAAPVPGSDPRVLALVVPPGAGGLDAIPGIDLLDLGAAAPAGPGAPALAEVAGVAYVAASAGIVRSGAAGGWLDATPSAPAWRARPSLATVDPTWPGARAVAGIAAYGGCGPTPCLLAARNVVKSPARSGVVPQLWRCAPAAADGTCAPADWSLVAPDARDPATSALGDGGHGAVSLLAATPRWVYVGVDGEGGARLYRAASAPATAGDLRGLGGCPASDPGCEGLGGNGLGVGATRLAGAAVVHVDGVPILVVAAGDGAAPLRLLRIVE